MLASAQPVISLPGEQLPGSYGGGYGGNDYPRGGGYGDGGYGGGGFDPAPPKGPPDVYPGGVEVAGPDVVPYLQQDAAPPAVSPGPVFANTGVPAAAPRIQDLSWTVIIKARPRPIRVHDIINITVDDKNEVFVDNRFNRSRASQLKAELKEFIRLDNKGNLVPAALNSPTIDANLQSRLNSQGQIQSSEGVKYRISAEVVDIRPNGNLVLEARKKVRSNHDVWTYELTGEVRPEKVARDFTVLSEDIANLNINREQSGKVHQSTKRPWGVVLYDWLSPF